ncbi:hypothetical protein TSUD_381840 [Trifolium subterraneum]|uniref:F-box domain-containing protein n=1 Tax=Trifolium subterraneum TaxID=3900 RepID=A0A2Z6LP67_TRISU|nr:hypothetical protein TSUD_381840 [Trifolium subterraneum]
MAPSSENDDDGNDAVSSDPITEETTVIPSLPFEIVEEILSKLPVKFLMQLKSVCKSWKSLISNPKFAKKHLRVSTTRHHVLITYTTNISRELVVVDYPFSSVSTELTAAAGRQLDFPLSNGNRFKSYIVGSCHGIICFEIDHNFALLWNPSIRKFMKLPSLENKKQERCYTSYGFGYVYDHFNDNYSYKVVAVDYYDDEGIPLDRPGRFVSGTVNWLVSNVWHASPSVIISLDLDTESYQEIMLPDHGLKYVVTTLVVFKDCLSIFVVSETFSDLWLMDEFGNTESWAKLFLISYSFMGDSRCFPYIKPLFLFEDDQVLLECNIEHFSSELAIYNPRDGSFKTTEIQNINRSIDHEVYQESLITPCS